MKLNKIILSVAFALSLSSCGSDYLDTNPTDSNDKEATFSSIEGAYTALNGIAKSMNTQQNYFGSGFCGENAIIRLYEDMPSQNWNYNAYAAGWSPLHNQSFHGRTSSIYDAYAWFYYYQLIGQANSIIAKIDNIGTASNQSDRDFIKASALTFRAYAFEKLVHYYCYRWQDSNDGASQGLVLRTDESTGDYPISTLAETYKQIYADCDDALALFASSSHKRASKEVYLADANVAHAVKARAALTKQDYATALSEAKLARKGYPLMTNIEYGAGFYEQNQEWIFGSYNDEQEQNWYWTFQTQEACNGNTASTTTNGTATIGNELINRIPNNDYRKKLFLTQDKLEAALAKKGKSFKYDATCINMTYGYLGWDVENNEFVITNQDVYDVADSIVKSFGTKGAGAAYPGGYYYIDAQFKFWAKAMPGVGGLPFIRSSEMLLIEAEANYFLGNTADAQANLVELNATSGRNPEYTCSKTGDDLFNEIKDYREVELWGEGFAWSDYKRWNIPVVRHSFKEGGNAHSTVAKTIPTDYGFNWTWQIPKAETDYNSFKKANATGPTAE